MDFNENILYCYCNNRRLMNYVYFGMLYIVIRFDDWNS